MKDNKKGCKYCKHNRERTLKQKNCRKGYRALYGFGCRDYEELNEVEPNEPNYEIGYQISIFDIIDEERRKENEYQS